MAFRLISDKFIVSGINHYICISIFRIMYVIIYKDTIYQTKQLDSQDVLRCSEGECIIISTRMNKPKQLFPDGYWRDLLKWDFVKEQVDKDNPINYKTKQTEEMEKNKNIKSPPG